MRSVRLAPELILACPRPYVLSWPSPNRRCSVGIITGPRATVSAKVGRALSPCRGQELGIERFRCVLAHLFFFLCVPACAGRQGWVENIHCHQAGLFQKAQKPSGLGPVVPGPAQTNRAGPGRSEAGFIPRSSSRPGTSCLYTVCFNFFSFSQFDPSILKILA